MPAPLLYLINGPNLNLLGTREPATYGATTLAQIEGAAAELASQLGFEIRAIQSNHEGALIDAIHAAGRDRAAGIAINPAGYTHTSVALRDALLAVDVPAVEVHLSNVHKREEFRHKSLTAGACVGVIAGLGPEGYLAAIRFLARLHRERVEGRS